MRILIVSDSHNRPENLYPVFRKETFDAVIHLGDYEDHDLEIEQELHRLYPLMPLKFVRGNCDDSISIPPEDAVTYEGVRLFMCHGNRQHVAGGRELLAETARVNGCQAALYGHTHKPDLEIIHGIYVFNPGSISIPRQYPPRASYGILTIGEGGKLDFQHKFL